jgi:hypothetical protein
MQRIHIALAVKNLDESIKDYAQRLAVQPSFVANDKYALFRTDMLNLSITQDQENAGQLRHLGVENSQAQDCTYDYDVNGIKWENFQQQHQENEILEFYPEAKKYS